ncbi:hypothetical protein LX36DRAFT_64784 [Colletotrichum falcatum]|nr:hypothetical protein LX36DRAFT_64784 [Colletotrichum falcatum]
MSCTTNVYISRRPLAMLSPLNSAWHIAGSCRRQHHLPCCCKTQCPSGCHRHYYHDDHQAKSRGQLRRTTTLVGPLSRPRKHVSAQGEGSPGPLTRSNCLLDVVLYFEKRLFVLVGYRAYVHTWQTDPWRDLSCLIMGLALVITARHIHLRICLLPVHVD